MSDVRPLLAAMHKVLEELELSADQLAEGKAELATLEAQAESPKPKREIVRASIEALRDITISAGGSVAAQAIMNRLGAFGM